MRATVREFDGCFGVELAADNAEDIATLVRLGMNAKAELRYFATTVNRDGSTGCSLTFPKHRRANNAVPRRR